MKRKNNSDAPGSSSGRTANTNSSTSGKRNYRKREDNPRNDRSGTSPAGRRFNEDTGERPVGRKRNAADEKPVKRTFSARKENSEGREISKRKFERRDTRDSFQKRKDTGSEQWNNEKSRKPFGKREETATSKNYTRKPSRQEEDIRPRRNARPFHKEEKPASRFRKRSTDEPGESVNRRPDRKYASRKEESANDTYTSRKTFTGKGSDRRTDKSFGGTKPRTREERSSTGRNRTDGRREKSAFDADKKTRRPGNSRTEERPQRIPFQKDRHDNRRGSKSSGGKSTPEYDFKKYESRRKNKPEEKDQSIRLNRYIANAGVCSRRDADSLIEAGEIKVNGKVITEMGYQVGPNDIVKYGNRVLNKEKLVYVLLNKPKDFITTTDDPDERKTVMDLVKNACEQRIYPVGRLDRNTTGLLLLTNDGEVAEKLSHPSNDIKKIYQVELDKPITENDFQKIMAGIELEDGKATVDDMAIISPDATTLGIEIHIGRNRIVRRIFEHMGYEVIKLDRVSYAGLTKKDLPRGHWRFLTEKEVIKLKYFI